MEKLKNKRPDALQGLTPSLRRCHQVGAVSQRRLPWHRQKPWPLEAHSVTEMRTRGLGGSCPKPHGQGRKQKALNRRCFWRPCGAPPLVPGRQGHRSVFSMAAVLTKTPEKATLPDCHCPCHIGGRCQICTNPSCVFHPRTPSWGQVQGRTPPPLATPGTSRHTRSVL